MYSVILAALFPAIAPFPVLWTDPRTAVVAAYHDAERIPPHDRVFMRYLWWNKLWEKDYVALTKYQCALLSTRKTIPEPVVVAPGLLRIDTRDMGWDVRLEVWENFRKIDFVFHHSIKFLKDSTLLVYYPAGTYDGVRYKASSENVEVKAGESFDVPAVTANPLVEVKPGVETTAHDELRRLVWSEAPIVWGPFWFVRVGRQLDINNTINGVGYYEWYGIKNRDDFFKVTGTDKKKAIALFQSFQAYMVKSGISKQERQLILLRGASGLVWGTLDVITQKGRGQPGRNLRIDEFKQDAEEWFGKNPLGLPINVLIAAKNNDKLGIKAGDAQAFAPPEIGGNKSALNITNDPRIHNGDTCWDCHGTGKGKDYIVSFEDWVRKNVTKDRAILRDPDRNVELELESNYMDDIYRQVELDRNDYRFAIARLTSKGKADPGMTVAQFTTFYRNAFYEYVESADGVTLAVAADEMGVDKDVYLKRLREYNKGRGFSDMLLSNHMLGNGISRMAWEDSYALATTVALGMNVPELIVKVDDGVKTKPKSKEESK